MTNARTMRETPIGELVSIPRPPGSEEWTDAQWQAHDAAIANALAIQPLCPPGSESWTDAEWRTHDAKVAGQVAATEAPSPERELARRRAELLEHGFPKRALDYATNADLDTSTIKRVQRWQREFEAAPMSNTSVLVISGTKGVGKTVASAWWGLHHDRAPLFARASSFAASSRYDRETRGKHLAAPALVLDDLGAEFADEKGSFLVDLDELVDVFYGNYKPLLITTNLPLPKFQKRYGERLWDRFRECGAWFAASGDSLRKPKESSR